MTLRNIAAASLAALALAACGDDDDDNNTKPITPDTPATPEACKAMKCVYQTEGDFKGSFVAKNEKGEPIAVWDAKGNQTHKLGKDGKLHKIETPDDGKKPGTAGEFDLSGEGVTEPLKEPVRGGSNYLRGSASTFDVKASKPNISSIAQFAFDQKQWNDAMDNFVAANPDKKDAKRAFFKDIVTENNTTGAGKSGNEHKEAFDADPNPLNQVTDGAIGNFYQDTKSNIEMKINGDAKTKKIEALANGSLPYSFDYKNASYDTDVAWAQEETDLDSSRHQNGGHPTRLYGAKVWGDDENNISVIANYDGVKSTLPTAFDNKASGGTGAAEPLGVAKGAVLPTAVKHDKLTHVQFGRLTGVVEPGELKPAEAPYADKGLLKIPFANAISNAIAAGGQSNATDFYFARGNNPTALEKMKDLKSGSIVYHGQALTYGVDNRYHGPQNAKAKEEAVKNGSLPNSVPANAAPKTTDRPTLLGGRGNFVVARFAPDQGKVDGSIYNVWNIADISPKIEDGKITKFHILKETGEFDTKTEEETLSAKSYKNVRGYMDNLIAFSGAVNGNKIEGDAIRYDNEKGKFAGAFFGDNAEEMGGVISSAAKYGQQPNEKWGAVFGAKAAKRSEPDQDLPGIPSGPGALGWSLERK